MTKLFSDMHHFLRTCNWPRTFAACLAILFLAKFIMRAVVGDAYSTLPLGLAIGLLISRALLGFYAALDRRRLASGTGTGHREAALSVLWRKTTAVLRFSGALSVGCLCWLIRKPSRGPAMSGTAIHYMKNSQYATVLAILLISIFADIPVSAMLVGAIEHDPERRHSIHILIAILTVATLISILGDRWYVRGDYHLLDERMLYLRIGKRVAADLPLCRIAAIEPVRGSQAEWCKQTGRSIQDAVQISPANIVDKPNICLTISEGPPLRMRSNMFECELPKSVLLYVDEPQALIRAIQAIQAKAALTQA